MKARKARGWTQKRAAVAIGLSLRRYGGIERGDAKNITSETVEAITRNLLLPENTKGESSVGEPAAGFTDAGGEGVVTGEDVFYLIIETDDSTVRIPCVVAGATKILGTVKLAARSIKLDDDKAPVAERNSNH